MVAPGKNLEFSDLPRFEQRAKGVPGLRAAFIETLQNQVHAGTVVVAHIRRIEIRHLGQQYRVYFGRKGNYVGLIAVFKVPAEDAAVRLYEEKELRSRYQ